METILVPTDFSPAAKNAAHYAVGLAKFFNSKLILLNAYPVPSANLDTMFPVEVVTSMQSIATKNLDDFKSELLAANGNELDIECLTEMGSAFDVINSTCKKHAIDLIVMGIVSEAGTIKEHIIGSSAVTVARYIEIPTFIIPQGIKYNPVHHISFACDMEKKEKTALINIVKYFGQIFDAQIDVINVEKPAEEVSYRKKTRKFKS
jgi:nucleotide-binding universal stress UspA family protein